jgi:putative nucleotidyltransferase with HDIG domain
MKKQILLVGNEPLLLRESPGFLPALNQEWDAVFVTGSAPAFELLEQAPFAAVVSDVRLPVGNGLQFLDEVTQRRPEVHRFILADLADKQTLLRCIGAAHQFLAKPCDARKLLAALDRAFRLEVWFANDNVKRLLAQMKKLPSPPTSYFQIIKELQSPDASLENVGAIIAQDPALTAKLLQLVNSAALGLQRQVASPAEAVMFLGVETTKSLVLLAHTFSHFDRISAAGFSIEALWRHSLATGRLARKIAQSENAPNVVLEEAFTAGLLHDLGKLLLAANLPDPFGQACLLARKQYIPICEAEQLLFGTTHAELGAWLAATWGLPLGVIEALALHHHPARFLSKGFCPLTAVHVANVFDHEQEPNPDGLARAPLDARYLHEVGLDSRLPVWRDLALNTLRKQAA